MNCQRHAKMPKCVLKSFSILSTNSFQGNENLSVNHKRNTWSQTAGTLLKENKDGMMQKEWFSVFGGVEEYVCSTTAGLVLGKKKCVHAFHSSFTGTNTSLSKDTKTLPLFTQTFPRLQKVLSSIQPTVMGINIVSRCQYGFALGLEVTPASTYLFLTLPGELAAGGKEWKAKRKREKLACDNQNKSYTMCPTQSHPSHPVDSRIERNWTLGKIE